MGIVAWRNAPDGRYWIDVAIGSMELLLMVDSGLTDTRHWVGGEVEPLIYDQLKQGGEFLHVDMRTWRDASGKTHKTEAGLLPAQLVDPLSRNRVGPAVRIYVTRGNPGIPSRVGVAFFHRLTGCRVLWELDQRTWSVEYP